MVFGWLNKIGLCSPWVWVHRRVYACLLAVGLVERNQGNSSWVWLCCCGLLACSPWACCGRGVGHGVVALDRAGYVADSVA